MHTLLRHIHKFVQSDDGPTAVEYAFMLALIITVCIAAIGQVGQNTSEIFEDAADALDP